MEPVSLSAGAIAALVLTKALEKVGEKIGEKAAEQAGKLMSLLKIKAPQTAREIEKVAQNPELAEQQPEAYSIPVLARKIEQASADPEIAEAVKNIANIINAQSQSSVQSITTIAQKVGLIAPGSVFTNSTFNL